jgi:transcriptional regulator with XRE-family HTH domain
MPNSLPEIHKYIREHIREIAPFLRKKAKEKGITNEELMIATNISHSTIYRIWKIGTPDEEIGKDGKPYMPDPTTIGVLCLALGVAYNEFERAPAPDSAMIIPAASVESQEKVMENIWGEVQKNREIAEGLESDNAELKAKNTEISRQLQQTRDDLQKSRARIDQLTDELLTLQQKYSDRVDRLTDEILRIKGD